jgi:hypothetical protein
MCATVFGAISHQKASGSSSNFQNKTPKTHSGLSENNGNKAAEVRGVGGHGGTNDHFQPWWECDLAVVEFVKLVGMAHVSSDASIDTIGDTKCVK